MRKSKFSKLAAVLVVPVAFVVLTLCAFNLDTYSIGKVQEREGYLIFIKSEPVAKYRALGTVKAPKLVGSNSMTNMLEVLTKKVKQDYPKADAILFNHPEGMVEAQAIVFEK